MVGLYLLAVFTNIQMFFKLCCLLFARQGLLGSRYYRSVGLAHQLLNPRVKEKMFTVYQVTCFKRIADVDSPLFKSLPHE